MENLIFQKSTEFAIKIIKLTELLNKNGHKIIANQILRSATSIGANIAESEYAASKADFANKLQISLKEANETKYWLYLLYKSNIISTEYVELNNNLVEIIKILTSSINSSKKNQVSP